MKSKWLSRVAAACLAAVMLASQTAFVFAQEAEAQPIAQPAASSEAETAASSEVTEDASSSQPEEAASSEEAPSSSEEAASSEETPSSSEETASSEEAAASSEELPAIEIQPGEELTDEEAEQAESDAQISYDGVIPGYDQRDMFAENSGNLKGVQGWTSTVVYNLRHGMINCVIDEAFDATQSGKPYVYNGKNYYFDYSYLGGIIGRIADARNSGMSISVIFLLEWTSGLEYLIDDGSRAYGYTYYAPAVTGRGGESMEAFWHVLLELCAAHGVAIDNFVLGNEVNDPNDWHFSGTLDAGTVVDKYARAYLTMYNAVRQYSSKNRCSISLDHNWAWNDEGREIPGRYFIDLFAQRVASAQANVDWSISYHLYPGFMGDTRMWTYRNYTPNNLSAYFIDGMNLSVLTNYVKDTYGEQHRILLTEQGFSRPMGHDNQVAAMAISYFAAKYDPMVDCFIMNCDGDKDGSYSGNPVHNFYLYEARELGVTPISGRADEWTDLIRLESGNPADLAYFESTVQRMSGMSLAQIVPNYGQTVDRYEPLPPANPELVGRFVERLYTVALGRASDSQGKSDWVNGLVERRITGSQAAKGFMLSDEFKSRNLSDDDFLTVAYKTFFDRAPDAAGKADWLKALSAGMSREFVVCGFAVSEEFKTLCTNSGITCGTITSSQARDKNYNLTSFVSRLYSLLLNRAGDEKGLNDWCGGLINKIVTPKTVAHGFVFSAEFEKNNYTDRQFIEYMYRAFLGREYDENGMNDWLRAFSLGYTREQVFDGFASSAEFGRIVASFGL